MGGTMGRLWRNRIVIAAITAVVGLTATSVAPWAWGRVQQAIRSDHPRRVPPAALTGILGPTRRAAEVVYENLDERGAQEAIVTTVEDNDEFSVAPGNLLIVAFDDEAQRWGVVFDANKHGGVFDDPGIFPAGAELSDLVVIVVANPVTGHKDVVVSANPTFGVRPAQRLAIVRYAHDLADVVYTFTGTGGGTASVTADGRVRVVTDYHTPADSGCCPVRQYTFELAPGDDDAGAPYEAVVDDRPWMGTWCFRYGDLGAPDERIVVAAVAAGSPADGVLRRGDVLLGLASPPPPLPEHVTPSLFDYIGLLRPQSSVALRVERDGRPLVVELRVGSMLGATTHPDRPGYAHMGWWLADSAAGVVVDSVEPDEPAAAAGIPPGVRLISINGVPVEGRSDVDLALLGSGYDRVVVVAAHLGRTRTFVIQGGGAGDRFYTPTPL